MSQRSLDIVRRLYDGWAAGDFSVGLDDLDPHVTFVVSSPFPEPAVLVGPEAISGYMLDFLAQFEPGTHRIRGDRFKAHGDTVIVAVTQIGTGKSSGLPGEVNFHMLFTFRGTRIVRMESVLGETEALALVS